MNFEFSEEQLQMRQTARRYLEDVCSRDRIRDIIENEQPFDQSLWSEMAEMGWTGVTIPEQYGGIGLGHAELAVLAEEIGRSLAPVPFSSSVYLATEAILLGGSESVKETYLPQLASGEIIGTFAFHEQVAQSNWTTFDLKYTNGTLTGSKLPVMDGSIADIAVVACNNNDKRALAIVDLRHDSVTQKNVRSFDLTRNLSNLEFNNTPATLLDNPNNSDLFSVLVNRAATLLSFEQAGGADRCLHDAKNYALERFAFGRAIGSFQAIKHKLADLYVAIELARSNAYYAIWALSTDAKDFSTASASAHIAACKAYQLTAQESLHIHGGIGYTWEFDSHLFLRRAISSGLLLGPVRRWKHALVEGLVKGANK